MSHTDLQDQRAPAAQEASLGRDVVESCLRQLSGLPPEAHRAPSERALQEALRRLASLESSALADPDHLERLSDATDALRSAATALAGADGGASADRLAHNVEVVAQNLERCRGRTIDLLVAQQGELGVGAAEQRQPEQRPFRASLGAPNLHWLPRDEPLDPVVEVRSAGGAGGTDEVAPEAELDRIRIQVEGALRAGGPGPGEDEPPEPAADHDDGDEQPVAAETARREGDEEPPPPTPPEAGVRSLDIQRPGSLGEQTQLRRLARRGVEELGKLGLLRCVEGRQPWHAGLADVEQRLLDQLDALVALGLESDDSFDLLGEVLRHTRRGFGADPFRSFARAFVLGCVEGRDTVRAAMLGLVQSWPQELPAQRQALALVSSPAIDEGLSRLAGELAPELQQVALEVMAARQQVDLGVVVPLLQHPEESLRAAAARCLGLIEQREAALGLLSSALATEFEDTVVVELLGSMLLHDPFAAVAQLRQRVEEERAEPGSLDRRGHRGMVRLLAIAGAGRDAPLLAHAFATDGALAEALGTHGHPDFIGPLLAALEPRLSPDHDHRARHRDEQRRRAAARALQRISGADLPAEPGESDPFQPTFEAEPWREWLAEQPERFVTVQRYRLGEPYTIAGVFDELEAFGTPAELRETDALEVALALGQTPLKVHDWVLRQQAEIDVLRSRIDGHADGPSNGARSRQATRLPLPGGWLGDRHADGSTKS